MNGFIVCGRQIKVNLPTGVVPPPGFLPDSSDLSTTDAAKQNCRIYVGNIPYDMSEGEILSIFGSIGQIKGSRMPLDPKTGKHKGYIFIEYGTPEEAQKALSTFEKFSLSDGRVLKVGPPTSSV